jgi:phage tail-like protein
MARAVDTDFYHNFRFQVVDPAGGNLDRTAGFRTCTVPDLTVDTAEYREGVFLYTRKYPGIPKVGEVALSKGVAKKTSDFLTWIFKCINGVGAAGSYRSDIDIQEFHISDSLGIDGSPSKVIHLREVFPISCKVTGDKDASSSDVAIQELTLAAEEIDVELVQQ